MNKSPKSIEEQKREIIRRARESQSLGNQQAVRECRAQLAALQTNKR